MSLPRAAAAAGAVPAVPAGSDAATASAQPPGHAPAAVLALKLKPAGAGALSAAPPVRLGQGLVPAALPPRELVGRWMAIVRQSAFSPHGGVLAVPGVPVPAVLLPPRPVGVRNPLDHVFGSGPMRAAQGLPQPSARLSETVLPIVERALTDTRLAQFDRLQPEQQALARTLLATAVDGLQQPPWSAQRIAAGDFDAVVDLVFEQAAQWQDRAPEGTGAALPEPSVGTNPLPPPASSIALPEPSVGTNPLPPPSSGITLPHVRTAAAEVVQGRLLQNVNSVEALLRTPTGPSQGNFVVDMLTSDEVAALDAALSTPEGRSRLLSPGANAPLKDRFLLQSLIEQVDPQRVDVQARQRSAAALLELADNPLPGEAASIKIGYRYVQDQPGGAIYREAVYTQIGQQLSVSPGPPTQPPPFAATPMQRALLFGHTLLSEFNHALQRPLGDETPDAAQINVLQHPSGTVGEVVQTSRAALAERFTQLLDAAGPSVQAFNRVLNVINPVVLAVGAGKTLFDFTQGRVIPRINDAQAAKLFNLPKGLFVASLTLRSNVGGVPTTYAAYVALGASRDVALLPGQPGGLPRLQIGTHPFTGKKSVTVLSSLNRSIIEVGVGGNVGGPNVAVMSNKSIRVGAFAANPLTGQINLPGPAMGAAPGSSAADNSQVSGAVSTAASAQGMQYTSLTGLRLGQLIYARRFVSPITYVLMASTAGQKTGLGRNLPLGGFSLSRADTTSDSFVISVNPAFDALQIQQLIDTIKQFGDLMHLESVLQQLERVGAIVRDERR
jgi:hypothetical protein